jgi:hypothetical protein
VGAAITDMTWLELASLSLLAIWNLCTSAFRLSPKPGVNSFGRNLQAKFRGLGGALRRPSALSGAEGAEFRGNGHRNCCHDPAS